MPSFPANTSAPSPRIAPRSTQDVITYSRLRTAPKISADGAGMLHGPERATIEPQTPTQNSSWRKIRRGAAEAKI